MIFPSKSVSRYLKFKNRKEKVDKYKLGDYHYEYVPNVLYISLTNLNKKIISKFTYFK